MQQILIPYSSHEVVCFLVQFREISSPPIKTKESDLQYLKKTITGMLCCIPLTLTQLSIPPQQYKSPSIPNTHISLSTHTTTFDSHWNSTLKEEGKRSGGEVKKAATPHSLSGGHWHFSDRSWDNWGLLATGAFLPCSNLASSCAGFGWLAGYFLRARKKMW